MKKLVLQINIPTNEFEKTHHETHKHIHETTYTKELYEVSERYARKYAERCGADYYSVNSYELKCSVKRQATYQRFVFFNEEFNKYDKILYIDSDYIIHEDSPNLFEQCQSGFNATVLHSGWMKRTAKNSGVPFDKYYGAGIFLITKEVLSIIKEDIFAKLNDETYHPYDNDQELLNVVLYNKNIDTYDLGPDWQIVLSPFATYGDHYASKNRKEWEKFKHTYEEYK